MTHLFCQDATETLLKLLHSNGTVGCAVSIALQCQKQTQTTLRVMQVHDPGSTFLFCTARFPWQGLRSGANRQTYRCGSTRPAKSNRCPVTNTLLFQGNWKLSLQINLYRIKLPLEVWRQTKKACPDGEKVTVLAAADFVRDFSRKQHSKQA